MALAEGVANRWKLLVPDNCSCPCRMFDHIVHLQALHLDFGATQVCRHLCLRARRAGGWS